MQPDSFLQLGQVFPKYPAGGDLVGLQRGEVLPGATRLGHPFEIAGPELLNRGIDRLRAMQEKRYALVTERLPSGLITRDIWSQRFEDINAFERHLHQNGTLVRKFFLHVSKEEQTSGFSNGWIALGSTGSSRCAT